MRLAALAVLAAGCVAAPPPWTIDPLREVQSGGFPGAIAYVRGEGKGGRALLTVATYAKQDIEIRLATTGADTPQMQRWNEIFYASLKL